MLLFCMQNFKDISKHSAIKWQTCTCDSGLLTVIHDFTCVAQWEMWGRLAWSQNHSSWVALSHRLQDVSHISPCPLNASDFSHPSVTVKTKNGLTRFWTPSRGRTTQSWEPHCECLLLFLYFTFNSCP